MSLPEDGIKMSSKRNKELFIRAISCFGKNHQLLLLIEECNELCVEVSHLMREKGDLDRLSEEIADVFIMLNEVIFMFDLGKRVEKCINQKLKRLENILGLKTCGGLCDNKE